MWSENHLNPDEKSNGACWKAWPFSRGGEAALRLSCKALASCSSSSKVDAFSNIEQQFVKCQT